MKRLFISTVLTLCFGISLAQGVFTTRDAQLIDASGQPFVIAGINNPHAWFGERAYQALDDIAATQANTVRIVWNTRGKANQLERIIKRCIARYLLINIANEWGEHDVTTEHWLQSYSDAVAAMRKAGFTTTLVVDAPGWGQNIRPILEGGRQLIKLYGNLYKI